jgi:tRNA-Thr(GGU) m(6)t(6)A37 methyltransferase TsaA
MQPIGFVRSPYSDRREIPKGPGAKHEALGILEIKLEFELGLTDIEGFSHLFVIWLFDRAEGFDLIGTPPTDDREHGVFATRSPRRPNPLGLTVVQLQRREGALLHVKGVDMLDGTPILDIKPYLSSVPQEQLRRGWMTEAEARRRRTNAAAPVRLMVRSAVDADREQIAKMRVVLWPSASFEEHLHELEAGPVGHLPSVTFVAVDGDKDLVGFVDVGLRSHADGCDPAKPVGFLEGWFVKEALRKRGIGGTLARAAEDWAREQGCVEMASDTWIDHEESQKAHAALGFEVVDRCVHFRKSLGNTTIEK